MEASGSFPLPEDPALAAMAVALRDAGHWADVVDRDWRLVHSTDDHRRMALAAGRRYTPPLNRCLVGRRQSACYRVVDENSVWRP